MGVAVVALQAAVTLDAIPLPFPKPRKPLSWRNRSENPTPSNSPRPVLPVGRAPSMNLLHLRPALLSPHKVVSHQREAEAAGTAGARVWQSAVAVVKLAEDSNSHHHRLPTMVVSRNRAQTLSEEAARAMAE